MSLLISFIVRHPQYECDVVKQVFDHEHPDFVDGCLEVSDEFQYLDELTQNDLVIQLIPRQLGVCLLDGDVEMISYDVRTP